MNRKLIELILITIAATMMFDFSLATFIGVGIAFATWETGAAIITRYA